MSLLSSTQGRPDRVRSMLRVLEAHGGACARTDLERWMLPQAFHSGANTGYTQTLDAARSLKLITTTSDRVELACAAKSDPDGFADHIHKVLTTEPGDADAVMMDAFAFFVVACEKQNGTAWLKKSSNTNLAGQINAALISGEEAEERVFNDTKYPAWRAWMLYMGLSMELPSFYPYPVPRLERELAGIGQRLGTGREIPADEFLRAVAATMPYLDGGVLFEKLASRMAWKPSAPPLSRVLSFALRELHDEKRIELHQRGDVTAAVKLSRDLAHPIAHFDAVTIAKGSLG